MKKHTNYTKAFSKIFIISGLSSALLMGCSALSSVTNVFASGNNIRKPAELIKLQQPVNVLQPIFTADIGSNLRANKDPLDLRAVFDGQRVFIASRDGKVEAFNTSGKREWALDVKEDITGGLAYDYASKTLVFSTREGIVKALDSQTGQLKWQQELTGTVLTPAAISPNKNRVLLSANDGFLYGLDLRSGQVIWKFSTQVPKISIRGTAQPVIGGDNALFATADGRIYAMNMVTGSPAWSNRVGVATGVSDVGRMKDVDSSPVIKDNYLYATSYSGQLLGINLNNRQVAFFKQVASLQQPLVTDTMVVVSSLDGQVVAYDRANGEVKWKNQALLHRDLTNPVEVAQYVAVGDLDGEVHLLDKSTGQIVSRVSTNGALNHLQVVGNKLVTQSDTGHVKIWQW